MLPDPLPSPPRRAQRVEQLQLAVVELHGRLLAGLLGDQQRIGDVLLGGHRSHRSHRGTVVLQPQLNPEYTLADYLILMITFPNGLADS